jgi:general secretion pathway protein F
MTADSPADGRRQLRDRGLSVERFGQAMTAPTIPRLHALGRSRRDECVADFSRLLALLLRNGVPLDRALQVMIDQARGGWQATLRDIRGSLDAGATLADSLTRHRHWFDDLFLGAIRVGEQTGQLDEALLQASEYLKERQTLSGKITTALVYPVMLSIIGLGVVLFLMTYVVPQLLTVLEGGGQAIPASTRILKSLSDLLLNHWIKLLAVLIGVVLAIALILRTKPGRKRFHRIQLRFPLIGVLLRKTLIARFAQQMSKMLASGIPFVEALPAACRSIARRRPGRRGVDRSPRPASKRLRDRSPTGRRPIHRCVGTAADHFHGRRRWLHRLRHGDADPSGHAVNGLGKRLNVQTSKRRKVEKSK